MANSEAIEPSGSVQALRTLVNREHLATRVYRRQIGAFKNLLEVDNWLRAASANEQEHIDHISARLTDFEGRPSALGSFFSLVGGIMGLVTRLLGQRLLLRADIAVERMAVKHYTECLAKYEWDEMSRGLLMHLRSEEEGHIERWERALSMLPGS
jgi:demethoxyubiquinone hydroxylase (CLK1/Coq7/Cat5 family)